MDAIGTVAVDRRFHIGRDLVLGRDAGTRQSKGIRPADTHRDRDRNDFRLDVQSRDRGRSDLATRIDAGVLEVGSNLSVLGIARLHIVLASAVLVVADVVLSDPRTKRRAATIERGRTHRDRKVGHGRVDLGVAVRIGFHGVAGGNGAADDRRVCIAERTIQSDRAATTDG